MSNTYLTRTLGTPTLGTKCTFSFWIKRNGLTGTKSIMGFYTNDNNRGNFVFSDDTLELRMFDTAMRLTTNRLFRDTSAWYHIIVAVDTTQGTDTNRVKIYINGVQETSFATTSYPSQNSIFGFNKSGSVLKIGQKGQQNDYFDGSMSHINFIDGTAYDASYFGSTDSATGEWKINTSPSVTYGNNGFFILKDGNTITDSSSNSNNFSLGGGTLTKTQDCPSNVFATWNPLLPMNSTTAIAGGNLKATTPSNYASGASNSWFSTMGFSQGKWYAEFKPTTTPSGACLFGIGFDLSNAQQGTATSQYNFAYSTFGFAYQGTGAVGNDTVGYTSTGYDSYTANDIIGIAVDVDNSKLYVSKNGTWQNSANPSSGTGGYTITADKEYFFAFADNAATAVYVSEANFGNGYFGTTAVSSAGTNASGIGIFEYDVPSGGYTALSTKGLNL